MKKVTMEMTETQARLVLEAVEEWFRLRMGQHSELSEGLAFYGYDHNTAYEGEFDRRIQRRSAIAEVLKAAMRIAFPDSYGAVYENTPDVNIASDIWSQLRWELSPRNEYATTPMQLGPEPMPKITVEDVDDA
jgi:hypothetical protein